MLIEIRKCFEMNKMEIAKSNLVECSQSAWREINNLNCIYEKRRYPAKLMI